MTATMTADDARKMIANRHRVRVRIANRPRSWLQVLAQAGPEFLALDSTQDATGVLRMNAEELSMVRQGHGTSWLDRSAPVAVEPLLLAAGVRIEASKHGHNGIAEALLLLASMGLPALFGYTKAKAKAVARRHVDLTWTDGGRFGGRDHDRGMAGRSYRFDRVAWVELGPHATGCPVWVGDRYERGLP